jgi:lipoprotein signal peptidase
MNEGIAFGLLPSYGILIHFIGILTLILLFFKLFSKKQYKYLIFIIIIFSATLSNFWDRVFLGAVIDNFSIFNVSSFNLADVIITINLMILIKFIIEENNGEKKFYS